MLLNRHWQQAHTLLHTMAAQAGHHLSRNHLDRTYAVPVNLLGAPQGENTLFIDHLQVDAGNVFLLYHLSQQNGRYIFTFYQLRMSDQEDVKIKFEELKFTFFKASNEEGFSFEIVPKNLEHLSGSSNYCEVTRVSLASQLPFVGGKWPKDYSDKDGFIVYRVTGNFLNYTTYIKHLSSVAEAAKDHLKDSYPELLKSGRLSDFTLVPASGREFHVHKTVLAANSNYFASMFEKEKGLKRLVSPKIEERILEILLDFMYSGRVDIPQCLGRPFEILCGAIRFDLVDLRKLLVEILCTTKLANVSPEEVRILHRLALQHKHTRLRETTSEYLDKLTGSQGLLEASVVVNEEESGENVQSEENSHIQALISKSEKCLYSFRGYLKTYSFNMATKVKGSLHFRGLLSSYKLFFRKNDSHLVVGRKKWDALRRKKVYNLLNVGECINYGSRPAPVAGHRNLVCILFVNNESKTITFLFLHHQNYQKLALFYQHLMARTGNYNVTKTEDAVAAHFENVDDLTSVKFAFYDTIIEQIEVTMFNWMASLF